MYATTTDGGPRRHARPDNPHNWCSSCGEDFGSVRAFDRHRVGRHAYDYSPERQDGRRCLSILKMIETGFVLNSRGVWSLEANIMSARKFDGKVLVG